MVCQRWAGRLGLIAAGLVGLAAGRAEADLVSINFEDLAAGTVVGTQYSSAVTFRSNQDLGERVVVSNAAEGYGISHPNFIGTASLTTGRFDYTHDVFLNFTRPVDKLTFLAAAVDSVGQAAVVEVFQAGVLTPTLVPIIGSGNSLTPVLVDLSPYANITGIDITKVTDPNGIGYDNFTFVTPTTVPEPSALILTGTAMVAWWSRKLRAAARRARGRGPDTRDAR